MAPCAFENVSTIPDSGPELHQLFEQVSQVLGNSELELIGDTPSALDQIIKADLAPNLSDISLYRQDSDSSSEDSYSNDDYRLSILTPFTNYAHTDTSEELIQTETISYISLQSNQSYSPEQFVPYNGFVETLRPDIDRRERNDSESSYGYSSEEEVMRFDDDMMSHDEDIRLPTTIQTDSSDDEESGRFDFWTPHSTACKGCERPGVCDGKCMGMLNNIKNHFVLQKIKLRLGSPNNRVFAKMN